MQWINRLARTVFGLDVAAYLAIHPVAHAHAAPGWNTLIFASGVAALVLLLLSETAVRARRPTLHFGRRASYLGVWVEPPARGGRRRFKREAMALSNDIHEYLRQHPKEDDGWHHMVGEAQAAESDDARHQIWADHQARESERYMRERHELAAAFGGRVRYITGEFERRGILSESEASRIQWETNSKHWITRAANEIEALVRRL